MHNRGFHPVDLCCAAAHIGAASDGRAAAGSGQVPGLEESPGSTGIRCRSTAGGGDPRDSATEIRPPGRLAAPVRVKRCGKSAPRPWQQGWHGKPHREQGRIGVAGGSSVRDSAAGTFPSRHPGWPREACREACPRGMVASSPRHAGGDGQNPAYRPSDALPPFPHKPNSDQTQSPLCALESCFCCLWGGGYNRFCPCCPNSTHDIPPHPMNDPLLGGARDP